MNILGICYLDCGDLHNGFARVKCKDCGHEYLLAFSDWKTTGMKRTPAHPAKIEKAQPDEVPA